MKWNHKPTNNCSNLKARRLHRKTMETELSDSSLGSIGRSTALLGLILVAIAPTVSVVTGFVLKGELFAVFVFCITKVWLFGLPAYWHIKIERKPFSWSPPVNGGWLMSFALGIGIILVIIGAYVLLGEMMIDQQTLYELLEPVGLTTPIKLAGAILFWVFINSVLEEYVFRWFITTKASILFGNDYYAIIFSAFLFTLHHALALYFFGFIFWQIFIASFGLLSAAAIWSWLYLKYQSIWVCWLSHAICDVVVFLIGYRILFM